MTQPFEGHVGRTYETRRAGGPRWRRRPPGAPNVVIVLLDDVGYAQFGAYGSDIATPTFDRLAARGRRYANFHTTALCSPTRACLLTGRNHHTNGMARVVEMAAGFPGYDATVPKENGFLSEILRDAGLRHLRRRQVAPRPGDGDGGGQPTDKWPLGRGFDRFYGFMGGETDQFHPDLVHDNHQIDPPRTPEEGYHLTEDLADHAIRFLADLRGASPATPFLLWFAPGACHAPHQAPAELHRALPGPLRPGLGPLAGRGLRPPSGVGPPAAGHRALRAPLLGAGLGHAERRRATPLRPDDGGLRRLPDPHRRPGGSRSRLHRRARRARQHHRPRHERQRRLGRGRRAGVVQRAVLLQLRAREHGGEPRADRRPRHARGQQPLPVGLGLGRQHAAQAVEARDPRGRRLRPAHRPLAGRLGHRGRHPPPVRARHRRHADAARADRHRRRPTRSPA